MLTSDFAGATLGDLELTDQVRGGSPAPSRAHQFPFCRSFNIEMSKACSATIRFRRAFSASSAFNRCASSSFNAPYLDRHRYNVCSLTCNRLTTCGIVDPCACSFSASRNFATICHVLNRFAAAIKHPPKHSPSSEPSHRSEEQREGKTE